MGSDCFIAWSLQTFTFLSPHLEAVLCFRLSLEWASDCIMAPTLICSI